MSPSHRAALAAATAIAETQALQAWPLSGRARPQSLAGGAVGIALLHIERARSGYGDEALAHAWLKLAASEPISTGGNANLFHGAPALGFALHAAGTTRYRRTLAALDDTTITLTRTRLAAAHARIDRRNPLLIREFDLIHGLTGLGVYHLHRHPAHPVTRDVLAYLVRLTHPLPGRPNATDVPPWWMPVGLSSEPHPNYPQGHGNLGMAHGISAVMALLSLAVLHGVPATGARDALARLCAWTDHWCHHDTTGPWWPGYLTSDTPAASNHHNAPDRPGAMESPVPPAPSNWPASPSKTTIGKKQPETRYLRHCATQLNALCCPESGCATGKPVYSRPPSAWQSIPAVRPWPPNCPTWRLNSPPKWPSR